VGPGRSWTLTGGYLGDPQTIARSLYDAGRAVIEFHS
jgi:hypothetical protein